MLETVFSFFMPLPALISLITKNSEKKSLFAQAVLRPGDEYGYLSCLAPFSALSESGNEAEFAALLEALISVAGERGVLRLLADVSEHSPAYELLRGLGFSIHTRQRIWNIPINVVQPGEIAPRSKPWRRATQEDWIAIQSLYYNLVPALVQKTGADFCVKPRGLVCYQNGELAGYIEIRSGPNGICAYPFIHPDAEDIVQELCPLLVALPGLPARGIRPVYACVSHYQSWLESVLEEQGAQASERMVLMARHLTARVKPLLARTVPAIEKGQVKTIAFSATGEKNYETHHR